MQAPLAMADDCYRARLREIFASLPASGSRVISIGAGNGRMEAELVKAGWDVLATDPASGALEHCRAKGLKTARLRLGEELGLGGFDVIYCDGVLGHLWEPGAATSSAWRALAKLGDAGSLCVASNDLSDDDARARFGVRGSPDAAFYRPPAGHLALEAVDTGQWATGSEVIYPYRRRDRLRRREILVMRRLLVDERVELKDGT
jgi:SAM-dependent methyltransferase